MADKCNVIKNREHMKKSQDAVDLHIKDNKEQQVLEVITNPLEYSVHYSVGDTNSHDKKVTFPYVSTKLRAEAPPFTPDYAVVSTENPPHAYTMATLNHQYQEHCFVNVNLVNEDSTDPPEGEVSTPKVYLAFKEAINNKNIKPLSESTTHPFKSTAPEVEDTINVRDAVPDLSPSVAIREEITPSQYPARSRAFLTRFTFGNSSKITILIVTIVISLILIIYAFV